MKTTLANQNAACLMNLREHLSEYMNSYIIFFQNIILYRYKNRKITCLYLCLDGSFVPIIIDIPKHICIFKRCWHNTIVQVNFNIIRGLPG